MELKQKLPTQHAGGTPVAFGRWLLLPLLLTLLLPAQVSAQTTPAGVQRGGALDAQRSDVVLVIDNSGSMRENDPNFLRLAAAKLFVDLSDPGDKIGVVVMSGSDGTRALTPDLRYIRNQEDMDKLKAQIDSLRNEPLGDETHMGDALQQAYAVLDKTTGNPDELQAANPKQFVVLLSDGLPTGSGQREGVDQAVARFRERGYWRIFSIALGGVDGDPDYLKRTVAEPTGAEAVVAAHDTDLINSYIDILARAGDDRYVDRVTVQPNQLASLVAVNQDQQPTQLSVVLTRSDPNTHMSSLLAPENLDLVQPFYQNTVRRGDAPEYELYNVPPSGQVNLVGQWAVNVEQGSPDPVTLVVLSRSKLRVRLLAPAPLRPDDDSSLRYVPLGRPLLLGLEARMAVPGDKPTPQQPFDYQAVTDMAPQARIVAPTQGKELALDDGGGEFDAKAADGQYTGLYDKIEQPGDYTVEIELPHQAEAPIHIRKQYIVRAAALPTAMIDLPPGATTLALNRGFNAVVEVPGRADFQIDKVSFRSAFVRRPDAVNDPLTITPNDGGRFQFNYTPAFEGRYSIGVVAEIEGHGPMGPVRYLDFATAEVAVPKAVPQVLAAGAFTETLTYGWNGAIDVPLKISSRSGQTERIAVAAEGLAGLRVVPDTLVLEPNEAGQRTLTVYLPQGQRPEEGRVTLKLTSPDGRVQVQGSRTEAPFKAPSLSLWPFALLLLVAGVGGFLIIRRMRKRQRSRSLLAAGVPRRLV